jgi:hypothetical protein
VLVAEDADLRIRPPQSFLKKLAQGNRDPRGSGAGFTNRTDKLLGLRRMTASGKR